MATPEQIAAQLDAAAFRDVAQRAMQRAVLVAERAVKLRTRVDTGTLRRSWTSQVRRVSDTIEGVVGTNIEYVLNQRNRPAEEGLEDAREDIIDIFQAANLEFVGSVG